MFVNPVDLPFPRGFEAQAFDNFFGNVIVPGQAALADDGQTRVFAGDEA